MSKKVLVFELAYGVGEGYGHFVRGAILAATARAAGYKTVLWSDGGELPAHLEREAKEAFCQCVRVENVFRGELLGDCGLAREEIAMILVSDSRRVGEREEFWRSLKAIGASLVVFDAIEGQELGYADKIISLDLQPTSSALEAEKAGADVVRGFLVRPSFFEGVDLATAVNKNVFAVIIGGSDPLNLSCSVLKAATGLGYAPILVAGQNSPHSESLRQALKCHPGSLWMGGLPASQMGSLLRSVAFGVIAPSSSLVAECFAARCPFVALESNPTLKANADALEKLGFPVLRLPEALGKAWGTVGDIGYQVDKEWLAGAIQTLDRLGYLAGRLPASPPFSQVDKAAPARLLKALGL